MHARTSSYGRSHADEATGPFGPVTGLSPHAILPSFADLPEAVHDPFQVHGQRRGHCCIEVYRLLAHLGNNYHQAVCVHGSCAHLQKGLQQPMEVFRHLPDASRLSSRARGRLLHGGSVTEEVWKIDLHFQQDLLVMQVIKCTYGYTNSNLQETLSTAVMHRNLRNHNVVQDHKQFSIGELVLHGAFGPAGTHGCAPWARRPGLYSTFTLLG